MTRGSGFGRALIAIAFLIAAAPHARAEDNLKLAIGARGNWETAAAELGRKAGFFKKRGLVLESGKVRAEGTMEELVSDRALANIYLGGTATR